MPGPRNEYGIRLERVLLDMAYVKKDRVDLDRACTVINKRTLRPMALSRLERLVKGDAVWTCDELKQVALGIGIDVREILYNYEEAPKPGRRPTNLWLELEETFPVD